MRRFAGSFLAVAMAFGGISILSGCAEDNEKTADIKGEAPAPGTYPKSQAEMSNQMKGGMGGQAGYPGAAKKK